MKLVQIFIVFLVALASSCSHFESAQNIEIAVAADCDQNMESFNRVKHGVMNRALLATRFENLPDLKNTIQVKYDSSSNEKVSISHCSKNMTVTSILTKGVDEGDFRNARDGGLLEKLSLLIKSPYAVRHRMELKVISIMARRRYDLFGANDVAFYDLALACVENIDPIDRTRISMQDTTEKGFINTFNHMIAQALVTSIYSEEIADFIADSHERFHMPELITGNFSDGQLNDPEKNPTDNYVDIVNNEWGQELGKQMSSRYHIDSTTIWTCELLAKYLNEMQSYFAWSFQVSFRPFEPHDPKIKRFTQKLNTVLAEYPN